MRDESRIGRARRRRGVSSEQAARKLLERDGWLVVRSAGSKGPFDLIALKQREHVTLVRCIQVKRGAADYPAELVRLAQLPHSKSVSLELWVHQLRRSESGWHVVKLADDRQAAPRALSQRPTRSGAAQ